MVTQALLDAGAREDSLTLVELNPEFACLLRARFPRASVLAEDAFALVKALSTAGRPVNAVVSSLPLYVYPKQIRQDLCKDALRAVGPHGRLVQFTYGPVSPIALDQSIYAVCSRRIWSNLPPAVVWTYQTARQNDICDRAA